MQRLEDLQKQLIAAKAAEQSGRTFDYYRNLGKINKQELKQIVYGPNWAQRDRMFDIIRNNPQMYVHFHYNETSREQQRVKAAEMIFATKKLVNVDYDKYLQDTNILTLMSNAMITYDAGFSIKNGVHIFLYLKSIFNLGTQKHQQFLQNALNYKDIGCFGLTQLIHGSNVKGLLTEAHYDHSTREFIINSPTKQAMKFWIGAAAEVANMSVIWAQLFIDGKCYGVHSYIVPLRDRKTHKLLPGVLVGDCGPKNGNNQIDNGFMLFDKVRIPVRNQLDRLSGVDQNGKFFSVVEGEQKRFGIQLGALSGGRFMISMNAPTMGLSALCIAIRYCAVRRQFNDAPNHPEHLLLDYPLTRRRLIPLLAQAIVYISGGMDISRVWDANYMNILNPQNAIIQQLHAVSSTLKVKAGWFGTQAIKQCRQMMGGHGYSLFSKLNNLYHDNDINNTWEGDNNVLIQQASKYVLDAAGKIMKGKTVQSESLSFLADPPSDSDVIFEQNNFLQLEWALKFLQFALNSKLQDMAVKMLGLKQQNLPNLQIWNSSQVYLGKTIALLMGDIFYLQSAMKKIPTFKHQKTQETFKALTQLWFLKVLRESEFLDLVHHPTVQRQIMTLCDYVTDESLAILESLSASDQIIGSPFACSQGKGFEKYVAMVRKIGKENERVQWWQNLKQIPA